MSSDFWNVRYATDDYICGTAPKLAAARSASLQFEQADVLDWRWPVAACDLVAKMP